MTKITFIGAGSLEFTSNLVRDILTFPLLEDAQIALMDINCRAVGICEADGGQTDRGWQAPGHGLGHARPGRGASRCGCGPDHHPGRQRRGLAARHRDPQEIRGGYQCRRYARSERHLSLPAHPAAHDGHRARHGEILPERHPAQLHQPDGHAVRRSSAPDSHPGNGTVPLGSGDCQKAGGLDRSILSRCQTMSAQASTTRPGILNTRSMARTPIRSSTRPSPKTRPFTTRSLSPTKYIWHWVTM